MAAQVPNLANVAVLQDALAIQAAPAAQAEDPLVPPPIQQNAVAVEGQAQAALPLLDGELVADMVGYYFLTSPFNGCDTAFYPVSCEFRLAVLPLVGRI